MLMGDSCHMAPSNTLTAIWSSWRSGKLHLIPLPIGCAPVRCRFHCRCADGADLMLPGIQPEALPPLPAGAVCSLRVPGNPAPITVRCASAAFKLWSLPAESDTAGQNCSVATKHSQQLAPWLSLLTCGVAPMASAEHSGGVQIACRSRLRQKPEDVEYLQVGRTLMGTQQMREQASSVQTLFRQKLLTRVVFMLRWGAH